MFTAAYDVILTSISIHTSLKIPSCGEFHLLVVGHPVACGDCSESCSS